MDFLYCLKIVHFIKSSFPSHCIVLCGGGGGGGGVDNIYVHAKFAVSLQSLVELV